MPLRHKPNANVTQYDHILPDFIGGRVGCNVNVGIRVGPMRLFRYEQIGIGNAKFSRWGSCLM